ncbi:hypothetical protein KQI84_02430 [bacterium]|nr:hypothetical protein [bacterium]
MCPRGPDQSTSLRQECDLFARYLIGRRPSDAIAARYVEGWKRVRSQGESDSAALRAVERHPALLPLLDAACALRRKDDPLRRKLILLTAILEASVENSDLFLPRHRSLPVMIIGLGWNGCRAVLKTMIGLVLLPLVARETP